MHYTITDRFIRINLRLLSLRFYPFLMTSASGHLKIPRRRGHVYAGAVGLCALVTLVAWPLSRWLDNVNIVMIFLLNIVAVALWFGRRAAVVAAFLSVALFDFFFVPPKFSFSVSDGQYLITFVVMLAVALTIGHLTTAVAQRADDAQRRADEQTGLYQLAQELAGALSLAQTVNAIHAFFREQLNARATILLPDVSGELAMFGHDMTHNDSRDALTHTERTAARAVYETGTVMDARELGYDDGERLLLPLVGSTRNRGVLIVAASDEGHPTLFLDTSLLRAVASLLTTAVERLHYVDVANKTDLEIQNERLRSSILAALSHDIRTPLTALYGLADALVSDTQTEKIQIRETAIAIRDQSLQLNSMVTNLLDMARIQAGRVVLRREWQSLDEVIGASIRFAAAACGRQQVVVAVHAELPLVNIDAVLIERVLCNLLENASKYSAPASEIHLIANTSASEIVVEVRNEGSGFPPDRLDRIFHLFERGTQDGHVSGMGVGLAICRAVVEAHGGRITASNPVEGGACVTFTLPRETPPIIDLDADATIVRVRP